MQNILAEYIPSLFFRYNIVLYFPSIYIHTSKDSGERHRFDIPLALKLFKNNE